jgi:hypothetical protein
MKLFNQGQIRLLQPKSDKKALDVMNRHGAGKRAGGEVADPNAPELN